jgi:hypothetical protein
MADIQPAVERLRARLYRFNSTGDPAEILGEDVRRDMAAAMTRPLDQVDMTALEIVAWLQWYRSQAGTGTVADADRESAVKLFELMYISDPETVPGALQRVLRERRAATHQGYAQKSPFARPAINVQQVMRHSAEVFQRYHLTGDPALLDEAVSGFRGLLDALPPGQVLRPLVEVTLGLALQSLWERSSNSGVLAESVLRLRAGLAALPPSHEMRPAAMAALAALLAAQHLEREDPALLTESAELIEKAAASAPPGHPMYDSIRSARDMMQTAYPASQDDPGGMDQAIAAARARLRAAPPGHPDRPERIMQLGMALAARFGVTHLADDLEETAQMLREAVDAGPAHAQRPMLRGMLGAVLSELAAQRGDLALSQEAIGLLRDGLAAAGGQDPQTAAFRGSLAVALWHHYRATAEAELLDEAITESRRALESIPPESQIRTPLLHNLASALHDLHRRTGDLTALDEAIDLGYQAERTAPRSQTAHRAAMNGLAIGLILRAERTGDPATRLEAVSWARKALAAAPADHPDRLTHAVTLAQALEEAADDVPGALPEAIELLRDAAHRTAVRAHRANDLQFVANALALAILRQVQHAPELSAVDEAIGWLRRATADAAADSTHSGSLAVLGKLLQLRFSLTQDRGAMAEALTAFAEAAGADSSPARRATRNVEIGRTAAALFDWPLATQGFSAAVAELPQLTPRYLGRTDQEFHLSRLPGLAADAAASALNARSTDRAAELLEQGRGILIAQALEMRADLDRLGDEEPERAARLAAIRDQLDALGRPEPTLQREPADPEVASRRADRRRKLAAEWDDLLAEVRDDVPAARPMTSAELVEQAREGPIVLLNVSRYRSDAILLTADGLDYVPLAKDSSFRTEVHGRVSRFTAAAARFGDDDDDVRRQARTALTDTLGWLWDSVTAPVLGRLGLLPTAAPPVTGLPRIWWSAGGPLALLPLHAAGRDGVAVLDSVVSSYTPSVRALRYARSRVTALDPAAGMLVVALPHTPGWRDLPNAEVERKWLRDSFGAHTLVNEQATRDRILAALPGYPMVHFAGHCVADISHPSASSLLCHDHDRKPLTVADLSRLDLPRAGLAYCSACSTSQTSADLADEAVHITGAFQLAGYPQVIGTLWNVGDQVSADVAQGVYQAIGQDGGGERSVAYALHEAMNAIRYQAADAADWAPYLHAGA